MLTAALSAPNTRVPDASSFDTTVLPCIVVVVNCEPMLTPGLFDPNIRLLDASISDTIVLP